MSHRHGKEVSAATIAGPGGPPSATSQGDLLHDGTGGAVVKCTVSGLGPFTVDATVQTPDAGLTIQGTLAAGQTGSSTLYFYTTATLNEFHSTTCTFTLSGGNFTIEAGHLWAKYACTDATEPTNLTTVCDVSGVVVFSSCNR